MTAWKTYEHAAMASTMLEHWVAAITIIIITITNSNSNSNNNNGVPLEERLVTLDPRDPLRHRVGASVVADQEKEASSVGPVARARARWSANE